MATDIELLDQLRQLLTTSSDKALKWADERGGILCVDLVEYRKYREECYQEVWDKFWDLAREMEVTHGEYSYPLGKRYEEIMREYLTLYEGPAHTDTSADPKVEGTHVPIPIDNVSSPHSYPQAVKLLVSTLESMGIPTTVREMPDDTTVGVGNSDSIHWAVTLYRPYHKEFEYTLDYRYPDGRSKWVGNVTTIALVLAVVCSGVTFD